MKKVGFHAYFLKNVNSKMDLIRLLLELIELNKFELKYPNDLDIKDLKQGSEEIDILRMILFSGDGGQTITVNSLQNIDSLFFRLFIDLDKCLALSERLSLLNGFLFLQIYDEEDEYWESTIDIQSYEFAKKDFRSLSKSIDLIGQECIDVSNNFGRTIKIGEFLLLAAPVSFFGDLFFQIIPKEYIMSFDSYKEKKTTLVGIKCILFNEVFKSKENRLKQKKLWSYLKFDQLSVIVNEFYPYGIRFDEKIDSRIRGLYS